MCLHEIQCDLTQAIEGKVCLIGTEVCFKEAASLKQVACQTLAMKHSSELHAIGNKQAFHNYTIHHQCWCNQTLNPPFFFLFLTTYGDQDCQNEIEHLLTVHCLAWTFLHFTEESQKGMRKGYRRNSVKSNIINAFTQVNASLMNKNELI